MIESMVWCVVVVFCLHERAWHVCSFDSVLVQYFFLCPQWLKVLEITCRICFNSHTRLVRTIKCLFDISFQIGVKKRGA